MNILQKEISIRGTLDQLSRALHSVTKENEDLKQRASSKVKDPAEMDAVLESNPESEEEIPSEASRIRRKIGAADLRLAGGGDNVPRLNKKPRDEPVQSQEQRNNQDPSQLPISNAESDALRSRLKEAEAHIINISGNLGALLPREVVEEDFKSLIGATQIWVTNFVRPEISTPEQRSQASRRAQHTWARNPTSGISRLRNQDFCAASKFPSANESIFLVMIFDLLVKRIFSAKIMYGDRDLQREVDVINQLVPTMERSSKSTKRLYNARRWMSEAMIALLAREETEYARNIFSNNLIESIIRAIGLRPILGPGDPVAFEQARNSLRENVVLPAIELGDKIACAIDKFSMGVQSYWSEPCGPQTRLIHDLENLDCRNFGKGSPRFRLDKIKPKPSEDELNSRLRIICPAIPALILTEACDKTWGPRTVLVKEQIWVAWDQEEAPKACSEEHQGYFWLLYHGYASSHDE
ncbi:hypothetical protein Daus18300_009275 [Diaporthe australafricana]|uniref:Uncharacterized protein n=1 Tax=Diaporthe australafricana TaxID=127596 RepID=A0ABR3WF53_9PEZI